MGAARRSSVAVGVGEGISVEVVDESGIELLPPDSAVRRFPARAPASLTLEVRRGCLPDSEPGEALLDSERWKVFARGGEHVIAVYASESRAPYSVAVVDFAAGRGELFVAAPPEQEAYPFFYPVDEIIFSKLLADRGGFIVHACCVEVDGRGLLFAGHSGAGKSTLAELFAATPGAHILSDDRVAVQVIGGDVVVSGTPWHGSSEFASPRSTRLAGIFFLAHGARNQHRALSPGRAAARLLALSVLPGWDRGALERTVAAGGQIAGQVPAAELEFVPDETAVAHVLEWLARDEA